MTDRLSPEQRSKVMSRIKGKDTQPEMIVRKWLHSQGFRFRLHRKDLPGHPDITLPKYKTVIFVHGCFWHRHEGCRRATIPATRVGFWEQKFQRNIRQDSLVQEKLNALGWNVLVIWECETKKLAFADKVKEYLNAIVEIHPWKVDH
jgi:DNA mismatch endonuclease (patch repair protein)